MPTLDEILAQLSFLVANPAVIGLLVTAAIIVLFRDWRVSVLALGIQGLLVGLLYTLLLPTQIVGAKLLVALFVTFIYFFTGQQLHRSQQANPSEISDWRERFKLRPQYVFRLFAVLMVAVAGGQVSEQLQSLFQVPQLAANGGALLVTLGLLNLGLSDSPFTTGLGLTTLLMGFGLFYAAVEPALAVIALLAMVDFAVALGVSYLAVMREGVVKPAPAPIPVEKAPEESL